MTHRRGLFAAEAAPTNDTRTPTPEARAQRQRRQCNDCGRRGKDRTLSPWAEAAREASGCRRLGKKSGPRRALEIGGGTGAVGVAPRCYPRASRHDGSRWFHVHTQSNQDPIIAVKATLERRSVRKGYQPRVGGHRENFSTSTRQSTCIIRAARAGPRPRARRARDQKRALTPNQPASGAPGARKRSSAIGSAKALKLRVPAVS